MDDHAMEVTLTDGRVLEYLAIGDLVGAPVVLFPGTPATAGCGALVADAAAAAGVHLIAVSRPGYGASSASPPGLASVASDTLELLEELLQTYAGTVFLVSHDRRFLDNVVTSTIAWEGETEPGLWREYEGGYEDWKLQRGRVVVSAGPGSYPALGGLSPIEAAAVARAETGDRDGAWRLFHDEATERFGDAAGMSSAEFQARVFPSGVPPHSYFGRNAELFRVFVADMHRAVQHVDGYVRDNMSWCGSWDIDVTAVTATVLLTYGLDDQMVPASHGEWLDARLTNSRLQLRVGGHGDVTFGLAADAYAYLAREV